MSAPASTPRAAAAANSGAPKGWQVISAILGIVLCRRSLPPWRRRLRPHIVIGAKLLLLVVCTSWDSAHAEPANAKTDEQFEIGLSYGVGVFSVANANFGAGTYDVRDVRDFFGGDIADAGRPKKDTTWLEFYVKPELRLRQDVGADEFFAALSAVYGQTLGDGDAYLTSVTRGNPGFLDVEEAYIGYRKRLHGRGPDQSITVQLGAQNFWLDDGFLVQIGRQNIGKLSGYYLTPRMAFSGWGTVRVNTAPIRGDIFVLETPADNKRAYGDDDFAVDQPRTQIAGFDIEWFKSSDRPGASGAEYYWDRSRYLNLTYFNVIEADNNPNLYRDIRAFWSRREGMNVLSVSAGGQLIPIQALSMNENGRLHFQYVRQFNTVLSRKVDAEAWYVEPGYVFSDLPWSPQIYYRYSHFSGQPGDPSNQSAKKRSYDPLFLGGGLRDLFGNYAPGELVGMYTTASSNLNVQQISLKLTAPFHVAGPEDALSFQVIGYDLAYDYPRQAGASSASLAREIDFNVQYNFNHQTIFAFAFGMAFPGEGGRQATQALTSYYPDRRAIGETSYVAEMYFVRSW